MASHLISSSDSETDQPPSGQLLQETEPNYDFKYADDYFSEGLLPLYERLQRNKAPEKSPAKSPKNRLQSTNALSESPSAKSTAITKKRKRRTPEEIQEEKRQKEERKKQREDARIEKMAENARKKLVKKAYADVKKSNRPTEAVKYMTARFDYGLLQLEEFHALVQLMGAVGVNHTTTNNPVPRSVMWQRTVLLTELDNNLKPCTQELELEEDVLIIPELLDLLKSIKDDEVQKLVEPWATERKITLIIWGLEKYFRQQKSVASRNLRKPKKSKKHESCIEVTRAEVESALVELQIMYQCNHRFVERPEDVAELLACFTKAIAECPHKRKRDEQVWDWYADADSFRAVKIDKTGSGVTKLWQQQIQQFSGIGEEIAQAITTVYPTPAHLINAYKQTHEKEGQKLLKDIEVRRGVGPLASKRKVGPELSKRLHTLFTDLHGTCLL